MNYRALAQIAPVTCTVLAVSCGAAPPQPVNLTPGASATSTQAVADEDEEQQASTATATAGTRHCNKLCFAVKTGADARAAGIDIDHPESKTIAELGAIERPASRSDERVEPYETTTVVIHGTLTKYTIEANDNDYHLVIEDGAGHSMIVEATDPRCVDGGPWMKRISDVRKVVADKLPDAVVGTFKPASIPVSVMGPLFFDKKHNVKSSAPNFIEIHPVLGICFEPNCSP